MTIQTDRSSNLDVLLSMAWLRSMEHCVFGTDKEETYDEWVSYGPALREESSRDAIGQLATVKAAVFVSSETTLYTVPRTYRDTDPDVDLVHDEETHGWAELRGWEDRIVAWGEQYGEPFLRQLHVVQHLQELVGSTAVATSEEKLVNEITRTTPATDPAWLKRRFTSLDEALPLNLPIADAIRAPIEQVLPPGRLALFRAHNHQRSLLSLWGQRRLGEVSDAVDDGDAAAWLDPHASRLLRQWLLPLTRAEHYANPSFVVPTPAFPTVLEVAGLYVTKALPHLDLYPVDLLLAWREHLDESLQAFRARVAEHRSAMTGIGWKDEDERMVVDIARSLDVEYLELQKQARSSALWPVTKERLPAISGTATTLALSFAAGTKDPIIGLQALLGAGLAQGMVTAFTSLRRVRATNRHPMYWRHALTEAEQSV